MNVGTILTGIASGNWLSVVGGVIGGITSLFSGSGQNELSEYEKSIQSLEKSIKRLGQEIKLAVGGEGFEKRLKRITEYQEDRAAIVEEIAEREAYYNSLSDSMSFYVGTAVLNRIETLNQDLLDLDEKFKDIKKEFEEYVTGGTAESLTDAILQGLSEGKKGIDDFAQTFEEAMQTSLLNIFKNNYLSVEMQKFYDKIVNAAGGTEIDSLTDAEIRDLQNEFGSLIENAGNRFEVLQDILSGAGLDPFGFQDPTQRQGMAGAITGITEDQADLLAGYYNAIRIDTKGLLNNSSQMILLANQQLLELNTIANNTRYNRFLESIDGRMATIERGIQEYQAQG